MANQYYWEPDKNYNHIHHFLKEKNDEYTGLSVYCYETFINIYFENKVYPKLTDCYNFAVKLVEKIYE